MLNVKSLVLTLVGQVVGDKFQKDFDKNILINKILADPEIVQALPNLMSALEESCTNDNTYAMLTKYNPMIGKVAQFAKDNQLSIDSEGNIQSQNIANENDVSSGLLGIMGSFFFQNDGFNKFEQSNRERDAQTVAEAAEFNANQGNVKNTSEEVQTVSDDTSDFSLDEWIDGGNSEK